MNNSRHLLTGIALVFALMSGRGLNASQQPDADASFPDAGGIHFARNEGQWPSDVLFRTVGHREAISVHADGAFIPTAGIDGTPSILRMKVGDSSTARPPARGEGTGKVCANFMVGQKENHRRDVPVYDRVVLPEVFPGTDLKFYGSAVGRLEYDFELAPGVDPSRIEVAFDRRDEDGNWKACEVRILESGDLEIESAPDSVVVFKAPYSFQRIRNGKLPVASRFVIRNRGRVGFQVGAHDSSLPLTIDPELLYSVLLSPIGANSGGSAAAGVAFDSLGNAWVVGVMSGDGFPVTEDAETSTAPGSTDVAILKYNPDRELVYATYLGGSLWDRPTGVAVDGNDKVWIVGSTSSTNFPVTGGPAQATRAGQDDLFLVRLNAAGQLEYATYHGGARNETPSSSIAIDTNTNAVWVCGSTNSLDFPVAGGPYQPAISSYGGNFPPTDVFISKFENNGTLSYATYFGNPEYDYVGGLDVDSQGNAWLCGQVGTSSGFPITGGARQSTRPIINNKYTIDSFISKFGPTGSLLYSSYIAGTGSDEAKAVAVDSQDEVWVVGQTQSTDIGVTGDAWQPARGGGADSDIFLHRYSNSGSNLLYGSYFGGSKLEIPSAATVDSNDNIWIVGRTWSNTDFPLDGTAAQPIFGGGDQDCFLAGFGLGGAQLQGSTYLGGGSLEHASDVAVDGRNVAWIAGSTYSLDFPIAGDPPTEPPWTGSSSNSAWYITRYGLGAPPLQLDLDPVPLDPDVESTVTLDVYVFNNLETDISDVTPIGEPAFSGSGVLELASGPSPASIPLLAAGTNGVFTYELNAVEAGEATVSLQVSGTDILAKTVYSGKTPSPVIRIGSVGDLLIRSLDQDGTLYAEDDVYQTVPGGEQIERVGVVPEGTAAFSVRLENDGPKETAFVLSSTENAEPGWVTSISLNGIDISAEVAAAGGWETPKIGADEVIELSVALSPQPGTSVGSEKEIDLTLRSTDASSEVLDSVRARAVVETTFLTVNPHEALLGEPVAVTLHYYNDTSTPQTIVTPSLGVNVDVIGDAELSEPDPANLAVLQVGEEAVFTYELKGTEVGEVTLLAQVSFYQNGGGPFFTSILQHDLPIGVVTLESLKAAQTLPDATLISGKPTIAICGVNNPLTIPKEIIVELTVVRPGTPDLLFEETALVPPGNADVLLPADGTFTLESSGALDAELFPDDPDVPPYPKKTLSTDFETRQTHQLNYAFCRPVFAARYNVVNVSESFFQGIALKNSDFLDATYPMVPIGSPKLDVLRIDWTSRPLSGSNVLSAAGRKAVRDGLDRIVMVMPPSSSALPMSQVDIDNLLGVFFSSEPKVVSVLGRIENLTSASTTAHELGHSFGFPDMLQGSSPDVPLGIWAERNELLEDHFNFMTYSTPEWVNEDTYEALVSILSRPVIDPEVLLISGSITPSGQVTADPWSTITTDQLTMPDPNGTYSIDCLDSSGSVLSRLRFAVEFEITEVAAGGTGTVTAQLTEAPFSMSLRKPIDLDRVVIRGPMGQLLYSRNVTPNAPSVDSISLSPPGPYYPGQEVTVSWTASDSDGDDLTFALLYSEDGGASWKLDCEFQEGTQCSWTVPEAATSMGRFKVEASDGMDSGERTSGLFGIEDFFSFVPRLIVNAGLDSMTLSGGNVILDGSGSHSSNGDPVNYFWEIIGRPTNSDGFLTNANTNMAGFSATTPGLYQIRLTVSNNYYGLTGSAITTVFVEGSDPPDLEMSIDSSKIAHILWPTTSPSAILEYSEDLNHWKRIPEPPVVVGDRYWIPVEMEDISKTFFRLSYPVSSP